jgi:hypothetical protein
MATKEDIVTGMQQVIAQARRVSKLLDDQGDWDAKRPAGWTPKEMFCHVAAVGSMIGSMGPQMMSAPAEFDFTASTNIGDLNAQTVASMQAMTPAQLTAAIEENYSKAMEFVKTLGDEQLQSPKTFAQMTMPAADLLCNIGVLHANHHLYEAALRVAF